MVHLPWCRRINTSNIEEVASTISPLTKLVWLESPTNPRQQITNIRVCSFVIFVECIVGGVLHKSEGITSCLCFI